MYWHSACSRLEIVLKAFTLFLSRSFSRTIETSDSDMMMMMMMMMMKTLGYIPSVYQQGHLLEVVSGYPPATKNASVRRNAAANNSASSSSLQGSRGSPGYFGADGCR